MKPSKDAQYRADREAEMVREALRRATVRRIEAARAEERAALELAYRYALERKQS